MAEARGGWARGTMGGACGQPLSRKFMFALKSSVLVLFESYFNVAASNGAESTPGQKIGLYKQGTAKVAGRAQLPPPPSSRTLRICSMDRQTTKHITESCRVTNLV